jgi:hypothetical protein
VTGAPADGGPEINEVEALITDGYLDSILAAHGRGADTGPTLAGTDLDADVRLAADRLARDLPRVHPSFRFEEALAARLGEAAARMRLPLAAGGESVVVPLAGRSPFLPMLAEDDDIRLRLRADPRLTIGHPLLVGGALTSAALSLAGAAYVAWRIRHPQTSPMARAMRAIARTRAV